MCIVVLVGRLEKQALLRPREGCAGGRILPYISYIVTFRLSGYHFQGSLFWTGYTISHFRVLNKVFPANHLLFSPFDHIIFTDFACFIEMHENANLCTIFSVLNTACLVQSWTGQEITALPLRQGRRIYIFVSWTGGQGFVESAEPPYPNSGCVLPPGLRPSTHHYCIATRAGKSPHYRSKQRSGCTAEAGCQLKP